MTPNGSYGPKTYQYGSLWLLGVHGLIRLQMAHMDLKLLNMANMDQYGSLWLLGVCAAHYGWILDMIKYGQIEKFLGHMSNL